MDPAAIASFDNVKHGMVLRKCSDGKPFVVVWCYPPRIGVVGGEKIDEQKDKMRVTPMDPSLFLLDSYVSKHGGRVKEGDRVVILFGKHHGSVGTCKYSRVSSLVCMEDGREIRIKTDHLACVQTNSQSSEPNTQAPTNADSDSCTEERRSATRMTFTIPEFESYLEECSHLVNQSLLADLYKEHPSLRCSLLPGPGTFGLDATDSGSICDDGPAGQPSANPELDELPPLQTAAKPACSDSSRDPPTGTNTNDQPPPGAEESAGQATENTESSTQNPEKTSESPEHSTRDQEASTENQEKSAENPKTSAVKLDTLGRPRVSRIVSRKEFYCFRGHPSRRRAANSGGEGRNVGCGYSLSARMYSTDPAHVYVTVYDYHQGHVPGSSDDVRYRLADPTEAAEGLNKFSIDDIINELGEVAPKVKHLVLCLVSALATCSPEKRQDLIEKLQALTTEYGCVVKTNMIMAPRGSKVENARGQHEKPQDLNENNQSGLETQKKSHKRKHPETDGLGGFEAGGQPVLGEFQKEKRVGRPRKA